MNRINNPLLEEFKATVQKDRWHTYAERHNLCDTYSWAIPDDNGLRLIAEQVAETNSCGVVEIGAGRGYWAWLLAAQGVDVVAYDAHPPASSRENHYHRTGQCQYHMVQQGGPEDAKQHSDRVLFLCWPPYDDGLATDALLAYEGKTLIYVGEGSYGCTANDEFFDLRDSLYEYVGGHRIPHWDSINDDLTVWKRRR